MDKVLELVFLTAGGKTARITVDNPKGNLGQQEIEQAMKDIIDSKAFLTTSGPFAVAKEARFVERNVQVYQFS